MAEHKKIDIGRELRDLFTKPSAFANTSAAKKLVARSKKRRKKKKE